MAAEQNWTHEKKVALCQVLENLPVEEHPHIYRIISARDPDTLEDSEDDPTEAYSHFHLLSSQTLRDLEDYVAARTVNTQSEIKENNPNEHVKENNPNERVKEENPNEHVKEKKPKSASNSKKTTSSKGAKGSAENTGDVSIKARPRRSSNK